MREETREVPYREGWHQTCPRCMAPVLWQEVRWSEEAPTYEAACCGLDFYLKPTRVQVTIDPTEAP